MTATPSLRRALAVLALCFAGTGAACAQAGDPGLGLRLEGGRVVLTWVGERGFEYTVERPPDQRGWSDATAGQTGELTGRDANAAYDANDSANRVGLDDLDDGITPAADESPDDGDKITKDLPN